MKIEAVIFDWAGTTVDYGCFAPVQAFLQAFEACGIFPTIDEVREPMGKLKRDHVETMMNMERIYQSWMDKYGKEFTQEDVDHIYLESEQGILNTLCDYASVNPFVVETIDILRNSGIKIGSTTGYTKEMMQKLLPLAKAGGYSPDYWVSAEDVERFGRPYPYMNFKNMQELRVTSVKNVLKVGDTKADIEEGKAVGVIAVGIVEGSSEMALSKAEYDNMTREEKEKRCREVEERFFSYGADHVILNMSELPSLIHMLEK